MTTSSISVVIPYFNSHDTIDRALRSVAEQTIQPAEIIIVDDGSTYQSRMALDTIVTQWSALPLRVLRQKVNAGPSRARNVGWNAAIGDWVAFLDADDAWLERKLELQLSCAEMHPGIVLWGTRGGVGSSSDETEISILRMTRTRILFGNPYITSSVMVSRLCDLRFDEKMRYSEDYDLWSRMTVAHNAGGVLLADLVRSFKRPYGDHGPSARIFKMQLGAMLVIVRTGWRSRLGWALVPMALGFSLMRFSRRIIVSVLF